MTATRSALLMTVAAISLIVATTPGPTAAASPGPQPAGTDDRLMGFCDREIDRRVADLDVHLDVLQRRHHLTDRHRDQLVGDASATRRSLIAIEATLPGSEPAQLLDRCRAVFDAHRVYVVVMPRGRLVSGADTATAVADALQDLLDIAVTVINDPGGRVEIEELNGALQDAVEQLAGVAPTALAVTPEDWNDDPLVLHQPRATLSGVHLQLADLSRRLAALLAEQRS